VISVDLPAGLVEDVEARLAHTDFDDASEYVAFALEEVLAAVSDGAAGDDEPVDRAEVERRLESLGYLSE
jgi:Arc/MetJ-type ribon-helix-helix transcriptional regulator